MDVAGPELLLAGLAATCALGLFGLSRRDEVTVLSALVIALFGLSAQYVVVPLGALGAPALLLTLACAFLWLLGRTGHRQHRLPRPLPVALGVFLWWAMLSYALGQSQLLTPVQVNGTTRAALVYLGLAGTAALLMDVRDRQRLDALLRLVVLMTGFSALVGVLQFTVGWDFVERFDPPGLGLNGGLATVSERSAFRRVSGTGTHAIEFGVVLAAVLPLALHYLFTDPRGPRWYWMAGATGLICLAIPMSVSRSAVLALAFGLGAAAAGWEARRRRPILLGSVVFVVLMQGAFPGLLGTLKALFLSAGEDPSVSGRTKDYAAVEALFRENSVVGIGLGSFLPERYFYLDNQFLGSAVETGAVGLVLLLVLLGVACGCARGVARYAERPDDRSLGQALLGTVLAISINFATFDTLGFPVAATLLFLALGAIGALWDMSRRATPSRPALPQAADLLR